MRHREKAGIVSDDVNFCAIIARLVKHSFPELHEYIRILFESGVKGPVVVLWLWCWDVDLPGDFPPFLL